MGKIGHWIGIKNTSMNMRDRKRLVNKANISGQYKLSTKSIKPTYERNQEERVIGLQDLTDGIKIYKHVCMKSFFFLLSHSLSLCVYLLSFYLLSIIDFISIYPNITYLLTPSYVTHYLLTFLQSHLTW